MATWSSGVSLKGPAGSPGVSVLFGQGAPSSGLQGATDGQQYFDTQNLLVYTWSASGSSWGTGQTYRGPQGLMGTNAAFYFGSGAPTSSTYSGTGQAVYFQNTGEVWVYQNQSSGWTDTGENFTGPQGVAGPAGAATRGSQIFEGSGPPPSDTSTLKNGSVTGAVAGDLYIDTTSTGAPIFYYLS